MSSPICIAAADLPPLFMLLAIMLIGVVLMSLLLLKLQQSLLAGYFLCGVGIANSGILEWLGGTKLQNGVGQMSDFGVMLLMFTLGLEFSLGESKYLKRLAFGGGSLQMGLCGLLAGGLAAAFGGLSWQAALILGVAFGMSSTAVSLKTFEDLQLSSSPGARFSLAVAIFQDLFIIVFFLFLPILLPSAEAPGTLPARLGDLLAHGSLFIVLAAISGRWVFPWLLGAVSRTRNRELFTLTVIGCRVGLAFLGGMLGLGLALGAFLAGLAVSESIYKHRILADVLPLKDLFLTLFFASVGLMVDLEIALALWKPILGITLALLLFKSAFSTAIAKWMGLAPKQALLAGLSLSSAGEFSLVLLQKAGAADLWKSDAQQTLLERRPLHGPPPLPSLGGMGNSTPVSQISAGRAAHLSHMTKPSLLRTKSLENHTIICGYGHVGKSLNKALCDLGQPTLVIELNSKTVKELVRSRPARSICRRRP